MREGVALKEPRKRSTCRHHWIIETPHGATSRGLCKRCGMNKRFPNAAVDSIWDTTSATLGRWGNRRSAVKPTEIRLSKGNDKK